MLFEATPAMRREFGRGCKEERLSATQPGVSKEYHLTI
jgi:hypothetical protein